MLWCSTFEKRLFFVLGRIITPIFLFPFFFVVTGEGRGRLASRWARGAAVRGNERRDVHFRELQTLPPDEQNLQGQLLPRTPWPAIADSARTRLPTVTGAADVVTGMVTALHTITGHNQYNLYIIPALDTPYHTINYYHAIQI